MSESDPNFSSMSEETFEEKRTSEMGRAPCQPVQQMMSQRSPQENPGQNELLLQRQVKQLQKVLQEQNTLLSLISPGLILSPTFLAHLQAQTLPRFSEADPLIPAGNSDAFKERSTKVTHSGEVGSESDVLPTNNIDDVAPSAEFRCLSPIKEEPLNPAQEDCPLNPFGSRQGLPPNPEERPIRPGLREEQKTFEEFVEEHLKTDQAVLQNDNQAQSREAETRNFLRKGEGLSRNSKSKNYSQNLQRRRSFSPQMMKHMKLGQQTGRPSELHQKKMSTRSSPAPKAVENLNGQRSGLDESLHLQDNDLSSNKNEEVKPWTANIANKTSKHTVGLERNYCKTSGSKSSRSKQRRSRVGFKKINDHIVKVHKENCLTNYGENTSKEVSLTDEVMESLALSDSDDSTSSEDGPSSQSHRPFPHYFSRHTDHKDLDLSEGDYASDAQSETHFKEEHGISTPTPSSSSLSSDSELKSLEEAKKTEESENSSDFRGPSAPKVKVAQDDSTHGIEQEKPHTSIREEIEEHGFNEDSDRRAFLRLNKEFYEPQDLRQQISSLKQQLMERECHWSQAHSVLQSRVEALSRENQELHCRLSVNERSHQTTASCSTFENNREKQQRTTRVRSATPAFNKPSIHKTQQHNTNGHSVTKPTRTTEYTSSFLSFTKGKNSALSVDSPMSNNLITQGGKGSLSYHTDQYDAQMASQAKKNKVREETQYPDGRVERLFFNGSRVITFRNGTKKEIGVDKSITVSFFNGDVKRTLADGTVIYYYCDAQTTHSTYPSGLEVVQFPNNQREIHHPDGTREISFPDGTIKILHADSREESIFPDGTVVKISQHGEKTVEFTNGQREIHTSQYKRRMYPDGTVKTVYTNGKQETKFSSGKVRIKNKSDDTITDKK